MWILLILGIVFIIFLSRYKKSAKQDITEILLNVPYEKAEGKDWCLPASGAMILRYYGENITQAEIARRIMVEGTSNIFKMVGYARELGYESKFCYIKVEEIEEYLRQCIPLIIVQKYSMSITKSHCRVIIGFNSVKSEFTLHDPSGKNNYKMSYRAFFDLGFDMNKKSKIIVIYKGDDKK